MEFDEIGEGDGEFIIVNNKFLLDSNRNKISSLENGGLNDSTLYSNHVEFFLGDEIVYPYVYLDGQKIVLINKYITQDKTSNIWNVFTNSTPISKVRLVKTSNDDADADCLCYNGKLLKKQIHPMKFLQVCMMTIMKQYQTVKICLPQIIIVKTITEDRILSFFY